MSEKNKKDYYLSVVLSQILLCSLTVILVFLISKNENGLKDDFSKLIEYNLDSVELVSVIETIKEYMIPDDADTFSVFYDIAENDALNGSGGPDLEFFEATKNTSFSPVFATTEICSPIERGRYTSYFGYRTNPISGVFSFHTGIDIAAPEGTNIRAAFSGTVTKKGYDEQAGNYIYLTHDGGFVTFYCHCSEILADIDAVIRQGETIALIGATGSATGPHVHFEVRKDGIRYNPVWLLEK